MIHNAYLPIPLSIFKHSYSALSKCFVFVRVYNGWLKIKPKLYSGIFDSIVQYAVIIRRCMYVAVKKKELHAAACSTAPSGFALGRCHGHALVVNCEYGLRRLGRFDLKMATAVSAKEVGVRSAAHFDCPTRRVVPMTGRLTTLHRRLPWHVPADVRPT
jgi:hypothetical protein